jgi:hypothetical protein
MYCAPLDTQRWANEEARSDKDYNGKSTRVPCTTHFHEESAAGKRRADVDRRRRCIVDNDSRQCERFSGTFARKTFIVQVLWHRHEALAHVATAEMLDLPLTESQANIEIEFADDEKPTNVFSSVMAHFVRRVRTQTQQLRAALIKAAQQTLKIAGAD